MGGGVGGELLKIVRSRVGRTRREEYEEGRRERRGGAPFRGLTHI